MLINEIACMKYTLLLLAFCLTEAKAQSRYDIVITEIMADPTPVVNLPNNEWIEIKNVSDDPVNLQDWRVGDNNGRSGPMPYFILQPGKYAIVCNNTARLTMESYGDVVSVSSFPSLDNDGDLVYIRYPLNPIFHAVQYSSSWYQNELKKEGGWSLEMIDPENPCIGSENWKASNHVWGGTPGKINSISGIVYDDIPPQIRNAYILYPDTIVVVYNEPIDNLTGTTTSNYSIDNNIAITKAILGQPFFSDVVLVLDRSLQSNTIYTVTAVNVTDCKGNAINMSNKAQVGLPVPALPHELVINEILFNPKPNGFDYVELYNNSNKIFDASKIHIANRNSNGAVSSIRPLSSVPFYIFPSDHIVVTEDADRLALNYLVRHPTQVLATPLPSLPDDEGTVLLLNPQGEPIDEVTYKDNWHFSLLDSKEGVALERIDPSGPSQDASNWHSAASTAGYGTPTYKNSQYRLPPQGNSTISTPSVFSPDNDGYEDIAIIQYRIDEPGYVANIVVFDDAGRIVRTLVKNSIMSTSGHWIWDGLNDLNQPLPVGIYIIFTEIFNAQGKKQRFKNTVVLARRIF
jgi:hypothetical protein